MEPHLSVLLYSKYSSSSKKLFGIIESNNINLNSLSLQTLCIDNEQIRNRIKNNKQLDINSVPCILIIYPDGGIEKYDGTHVFEWVEQSIKQITQSTQKVEEQLWREEQKIEKMKLEEEKKQIEIERQLIREEYKKKDKKSKINHERKPIQINGNENISQYGHTSIDELDSEGDRYRKSKPRGHIIKDSGNYIHDDDLFQDPQTDMYKTKSSSVKEVSKNASEKKSMDLMAKAKELAKGREENDPLPPPGHPINKRI